MYTEAYYQILQPLVPAACVERSAGILVTKGDFEVFQPTDVTLSTGGVKYRTEESIKGGVFHCQISRYWGRGEGMRTHN